MQLFCFPHAGAGASVYREWVDRLADRIEVVPVQLPGREARFSEAPLSTVTEIIEQLIDPLLERADKPFAVFGHSMGALLSFEVTHTLTQRCHQPLHLFLSGYSAPHLRPAATNTLVHTWPDAELAEHLINIGGIAVELIQLPELLRSFLPALRADLAIGETYRYLPRPALPVPITVLAGRDDPTVNVERLDTWSALSGEKTTIKTLPGGHFYLDTQLGAVLEIIRSTLLVPCHSGTWRSGRATGESRVPSAGPSPAESPPAHAGKRLPPGR